MNLKFLSLSASMIALVWALQAQAITDEQYNSIKGLGELNGVALHCKFLTEIPRMKLALVTALPKRRQLGEAFESITSESFLAFIQADSTCPEEMVFTRQVDDAIDRLNAAFPAK